MHALVKHHVQHQTLVILFFVLAGIGMPSVFALSLDYPAIFRLSDRPVTGAAMAVPVGAAPVARAFEEDGVTALRLNCPFHSTASERAAWDMPVRADLRFSGGLRFKIRASNLSSFGYFTFYFKSGNGWYVHEFSITGEGEWETVEVRKADTRIEGGPGGWRDISAFRISAWRGDGSSATLDIAGFGLLPARPELVVLRGTTAFQSSDAGEKNSRLLYPRRIADLLANYGLEPLVVEESDLAGDVLRRTKVLILPYNPTLPREQAMQIAEFVEHGGRVVGFYTVPGALSDRIGIRATGAVRAAEVPGGFATIRPRQKAFVGAPESVPHRSWIIHRLEGVDGFSTQALAVWETGEGDVFNAPAVLACDRALWFSHVLLNDDPGEGGRILLAALGRFWPDAWRLAATYRRGRIASELPYADFDAAWKALVAVGRSRPKVVAELNAAVQARRNGTALLERGAFFQAIHLFEYAAEHLTQAYLCSRTRPLNEFKAAWCHSGDGAGGGWDASIQTLKQQGFNVMLGNVMNAGMAWFPSQFLPGSPSVDKGGDPLRDLVLACRRYRVQCHAWVMCFRMGDHPDPEFVARMKREGRLQVKFDGTVHPLWLCPNEPHNQVMLLSAIREIVSKYGVDGVHLDYIRYPGQDACFCKHCRAEFERFVGHRVEPWPTAVRRDANLAAQWLAFRRRSIDRFVASVRNVVKQSPRPKTFVSAAVFRNESSAENSIAQDWVNWARNGWVDFVCPMNYTGNLAAFRNSTARQLQLGARLGIAVFPGIGLTSHHLGSVEAIRQIEAARQLGTSGFVIFQFNHATKNKEFADFAKSTTANRP